MQDLHSTAGPTRDSLAFEIRASKNQQHGAQYIAVFCPTIVRMYFCLRGQAPTLKEELPSVNHCVAEMSSNHGVFL